MPSDNAHVKLQVARILEHLRTIELHYGDLMAESDPEAWREITAATCSLERVVSDTAFSEASRF